MEEENRRICECCGAKMVEYRHALNKGMTIALKELYDQGGKAHIATCLLYTSPSPRDKRQSRMPSSA